MRKYNRKILTALVIAYKKGIINKKPLNKWLKADQVLYRAIKHIAILVLFSVLFFLLDRNMITLFALNEEIIFAGYIVTKSRVVSGIVLGLFVFVFYLLIKFLTQVRFVKKAMKKYSSKDFDVEKLNNVTFKIHV